MVAVFGRVKKQKAPRAAGETAELRQMESLEVWAASLKAKQLAAVRADRREQSLEGLYWLAVLKGKAYTLAEDTVINTNTIPAHQRFEAFELLHCTLAVLAPLLGRRLDNCVCC